MVKETKAKLVEKDELNEMKERLTNVEETLAGMVNKLDAMNKYYAQTSTVVSEHIAMVHTSTTQIQLMYKQMFPNDDALELSTTKKKAVKKKK